MKCNYVNCKYFNKKDEKIFKGSLDHIFELDSGCEKRFKFGFLSFC